MCLTLVLTLFSASLAGAAELQRAPLTKSFDTSEYTVSAKPRIRKHEVKKIFEHTCASEGYQCASGYQCEFIMSASGENALGNPLNLPYNRTNLRYYSCKATGYTTWPTCSKGLTPSGHFHSDIHGDLRRIPGGVREYHCQQAL